MALIDDVRQILLDLPPAWRTVLKKAGLSLSSAALASAAKLEVALTKDVEVDRTVKGFEDFALDDAPGVTPGDPARSLLYHALASPNVHPTAKGEPTTPDRYPTLVQLDTVENYIYSLARDGVDTAGTFVAVLAYQYRPGRRTPHGKHADLVFSRTGVARVGTKPHHYAADRRSFWALPTAGGGLAALPARYGVFLARMARATEASIAGGEGEAGEEVALPLHKLFDGTECLPNGSLTVKLFEHHVAEKLRRIHDPVLQGDGGLAVDAGFDIDAPPFRRTSTNGGGFVTLKRIGATWLVVPKAAPLVVTATQQNARLGRKQLVNFAVPARATIRGSSTRFTTSTLEIPAFGAYRLAPEYVNIRHEVDPDGPTDQKPVDLQALGDAAWRQKLKDGGYNAVHFLDNTGHGAVAAVVTGPGVPAGGARPAFSLVTAPDFFPLADQMEVAKQRQIVGIDPLAVGRHRISNTARDPLDESSPAFAPAELTVTAVVSAPRLGKAHASPERRNRAISWLPDAASDIFAPGWDVSLSREENEGVLTAFGLGSPFPEDAKLCAALSSFWPAAAPDASRTFGNGSWLNGVPMIDEELGFHPDHPEVQAGTRQSYRGWDGEYGPFFEPVGGARFVNHAVIERSDYVTNALKGFFRLDLTAEVQADDLVARYDALRASRTKASVPFDTPLVSFTAVENWAGEPDRGSPSLKGAGFRMKFAQVGPPRPTADVRRVQRPVTATIECHVDAQGRVARSRNAGAFKLFP